MDKLTDQQMNGQMDAQMDRRMNGWMDMYEQTDGGWTDGRTDEWMDG